MEHFLNLAVIRHNQSSPMAGINKVILVGHLGKDPDIRVLPDDVAVVSFPLAPSSTVLKHGIRTEQTEWHHIVMRRAVAEAAYKLLKKGKLIYVEGKCRTRSFEDMSGIMRYTTEIVADSFTLLGRMPGCEPEEISSKPTGHSEE